MTDLTPFIAPAAALESFRASQSEYHVIVLLQRGLGDDEAVLGVADGAATGDDLAKQVARELQLAYDDGMAGRFQILNVARDLGPHVRAAIRPDTPLSPWQREFSAAYEADCRHNATLAETAYEGDTIYAAVMLELDAKEGCDGGAEAVRRLDVLIEDLLRARDAITV